jgi:membrane-bound lytic murein transglycosylase D
MRLKRRTRLEAASGAFVLGALLLAIATGSAGADERHFPRPKRLEPAVGFWRDIFATYSQHQVVVHDDWYLGKVYEVLDFRSWVADGEPLTISQANEKKRQVDEAKERVRRILLRLHTRGGNARGLTTDERKVHAMFADVGGASKFRDAADRVRAQSGLRERFALGVARQKGYLSRMEAIFREQGLPVELARMPLIESCFDVNAYSKVGAAGIWQFMPATGKQYLTINGAVDERRDPLRATRAAARHLSGDYGSLGSWPLAITAYNHGRGGIARGVREVGTDDIGEIVFRYRGRAFGFASRNFYAEFLAALDVVARANELFGDLPHIPPLEGEEIRVPQPMGVQHAARLAGVRTSELIVANPAFLSSVTDGRTYIPRGFTLRVPPGGDAVRIASASAPARVQVASSKSSRKARKPSATAKRKKTTIVVHRVRRGQTLGGIARKYGTTVEAIKGMNKVSARALQVGQRLRIPHTT